MIEYVDSTTGELIDLETADGLARAVLAQEARLERLTSRLDRAADALEVLQEQMTDSAGAGFDGLSAWTWSTMGPMGADALWRRLEAWVGWLRGRYPLAEQLPGCWWRHSELVEEVTALHLAWRAAYSDPAAQLTAPIDWHAHHLPAFLARIRGWGVHCTDAHRDRPDSLYTADGVDDQEGFDAFLTADGAARRDAAMTARRPTPSTAAEASPSAPADDEGSGVALPTEEITAAIAVGRAQRLTRLPESPVLLDDHFWLADGARYVRVDDPRLDAQLRNDHQRMAAADAAVSSARARESDPTAGDEPPTRSP